MATSHAIETLETLQMTIEGNKYDVTNWQEYHPGGKLILQQYNEKDATDVFSAFHSEEAYDVLHKMKSTPVTTPEDPSPEVLAYRQLRLELEEEGFFDTNWTWEVYKIGTTYGLFLSAVFLAYCGYWLPSAIALGVFYQQAGWLGHDFCHHTVFKNRKLGNFFGYLTGNVLSGFSVNWWKDRHNTHHAITNVLDSDPDIDNLPLFVWTEKDLHRTSDYSLSKTILPYQQLYFPIFTMFLKMIWCLQSFLWLKEDSAQNKSYLKSRAAEQNTLFLHWLIVFAIMFFWVDYKYYTLYLFISEAIGGSGIALVVFMNHYSLEHFTVDESKPMSFVKLQLLTTRNINAGIITDWICGGLNYQVEHHLFPTVPRHNLSKLKPKVEALCAKYDLPYQSESFTTCFMEVEKKLAKVSAAYRKMAHK